MATVVNRQTMSDAELIAASRTGDADAYGELYKRHSPAARAAARAMCRNRSDADDLVSEAFLNVLRILQNGNGPELAFRPYLLVAVRNRFYDRTRRKHEDPIDQPTDELNLRLIETADAGEDKMLVSAAFATLPERWQLVLWHTEIEGRTPAEVAPLLGMAPNAVAALAYRAREGLRQAFLQAHLQTPQDLACRDCAAQLAAYVRDALSDRDRRKVDAHLSECERCRALLAELCDTNTMLRAGLLPVIIGVPAAAYLSGIGKLGGHGATAWFSRMSRLQQAGAAASAAAATVAIAVTAAVVSTGGTNHTIAAPPTTTRPPAAVAGLIETTTTSPTKSASTSTGTTIAPGSETSVPGTGGTAATSTTLAGPVNRVPIRTVPQGIPTAPTTTAVASEAPPVPTTTAASTVSTSTTTTVAGPIIPTLAVASLQLGIGLLGGEVRVQLTVSASALPTNQFHTNAFSNLVVALPLPPGIAMTGVDNPSWTCTAQGACTIASLATGGSSTAVVRLSIALNVGLPISLTPTVTNPPNAVVQAQPLAITTGTIAGLQVQEFARGAVAAVSNTLVSCITVLCLPVDVDADKATTNSSTADLALTGTVSKALLVWSGDSPSPDRGTVRFMTGGTAVDVVADKVIPDYSPEYKDEFVAYSDVTNLVRGSGTYGVGFMQSSLLSVSGYGGWSLIVITHDASLPERSLMIALPLTYVTDATPVSLPLAASSSATAATHVVVSAFEGDSGLLGDTLKLTGVDLGALGDAFHGAIAGVPRNPQLDGNNRVDLLDVVGVNGSAAAATLDFVAGKDPVMIAAVGIALDLS